MLYEYWVEFVKTNNSLYEFSDSDEHKEHEYFKLDRYTEGELDYTDARTVLQEELEKFGQPSRVSVFNEQNNARSDQSLGPSFLKVEPPVFDGSQKSWEDIKELFTALVIDDNHIGDALRDRKSVV